MKFALPLLLAITLAFAGAAPLAAQATNDAFLTFTVNGVDGVAPNAVEIERPGTAALEVNTQSANLPIIIAFGSGLSIADQIIGPVQVDVGPAAETLVNGVTPTTLLDSLGNTGFDGNFQLNLPIGSQVPAGTLAGLQVFAVDFTAPLGVVDSAATLVEVVVPVDYGSVSYLQGSGVNEATGFAATAGAGSTQFDLPAPSVDIKNLYVNTYTEFIANSGDQVDSEIDPAVLGRAVTQARNISFSHIVTTHGALYHFQDLTADPAAYGFAIQQPGGAMQVIPGSVVLNPTSSGFQGGGSPGQSPWEIEVAISQDQNTMCVVFDPSSGDDQVYLIKLDGTVFPGTGTEIANITPPGADDRILPESLRFSGDRAYFVDAFSTGILYGAPADGSALAAPVVFPLTGEGLAVTAVDGETVRIEGSDSILVLAEASTGAEDLYVISNTGGVETVTNITNFSTATDIETLDDAYDGFDGDVGISPDGSRVAFITRENNDDELYWVTTDGLGTPVHLTPNTAFEETIDHIQDINFWDNQNILVFVGTTASRTDLYNIQLTGGSGPVFTNVTATNGQDGSVLPISALPVAGIDPDGYFTVPGRMFFARDGTPSAGNGNSSSMGLVGVEYATLTPYNILGDEFPGPAGEVGFNGANISFEITFAPAGNTVWFKSPTGGSSFGDQELFGFDVNSSAPALNHSVAGTGGTNFVRSAKPDPTGLRCAFTLRPSAVGDEEIFVVDFGVPGATQVSNGLTDTDDVTEGSIAWFPPSAPQPGLVYSQGTSTSINPSDAFLRAVNLVTGQIIDISPIQGMTVVTGISYP